MTSAPTANIATLHAILLDSPNEATLTLPRRMRNHHAPVYLNNSIVQVTLTIQPSDLRARVVFNGLHLPGDAATVRLDLAVGMNEFAGSITSHDGTATVPFACKLVRLQPQPVWERVLESAPWQARDSAAELVFNNRLWIIGGFVPEFARDVWSSANGVDWTHESDIPSLRGFDIPIAFVLNGAMFVADVDGVLFRSEDGHTWTVATESAPWRGRSGAGAAVFAGKAWIMGGKSIDGRLLHDVWSSSDGVAWSLETPAAAWCGRVIHQSPLVLDGKLFLLGGGTWRNDYFPFVAWNDVWVTENGRDWHLVLEQAPWTPRIWGAAAVYRDRLWVLGGFRSDPTWENLGDVWYSSDGSHWYELKSPPAYRHGGSGNTPFEHSPSIWYRRHEHSALVLNDSLWVMGGMIWPLLNDVWRLRIPGMCFLTEPELQAFSNGDYLYAARADFHRSRSALRYRLTQAPVWLVIEEATGVIRGRCAEPGRYPVTLTAIDEQGDSAVQEFTLQVLSCR